MAEIIGVRFKGAGKVYYFAANGITASVGDTAVVETARGIECGEVMLANQEIPDEQITAPLKSVIRLATKQDLLTLERNRRREQEAFGICEEKIRFRNLDMKLVDVECTFDNTKMLFYFTADARVDFRELVKDLAGVFRTRIELRQIGVRDEAKILGGLGICGREFCCKGYLGDFQPVSIKMAKEQGLSLNPTKISGTCGRLMCCLKHEQYTYEQLLKVTPRQGALVRLEDERQGVIEEVSLLTGKLKVRIPVSEEESELVVVDRESVEVLRKDKEPKQNPPRQKQPKEPRETKPQTEAKPKEQTPKENRERRPRPQRNKNHPPRPQEKIDKTE